MDISYTMPTNIQVDKKTFTTMNFLYNAINEGWTVTKQKNKYIFTKRHDGKKEVFTETFLDNFIQTNLTTNKRLI
jgi:hypothetical protein